MKTHIKRQQHKKFKHQDVKQKEQPQKPQIFSSWILMRTLVIGENQVS